MQGKVEKMLDNMDRFFFVLLMKDILEPTKYLFRSAAILVVVYTSQ